MKKQRPSLVLGLTVSRFITSLIPPGTKERVLDITLDSADWIFEKIPLKTHQRVQKTEPLRLISHRGAWKERGCLENTFAAFDRAKETGIWGLEFDIRFTKDDVPLIHHDASLLRTFGRPTIISNSTLSTLHHEAPDVPTLEDFCKRYENSFHIFIEIKNSAEELTELRLHRLLTPLRETFGKELSGVHFMSFDFHVLKKLHADAGIPKRSLVSIATLKVNPVSDQTLKMEIGGFTCHWLFMNEALLLRHQNTAQKCGVGFVNSKACLKREWARGTDWIFTNDPVHATKWLNEITS